jgi:hypothetical protein
MLQSSPNTEATEVSSRIISNAREAVIARRIDGEGAIESHLGQIVLAANQAASGIISTTEFQSFLGQVYNSSLDVTEPATKCLEDDVPLTVLRTKPNKPV